MDKEQSTYEILWRGIKGNCPNCGTGHIFRSYIKPYDNCPNCNEDFTTIRADDAPPWLTILITGHIVAPIMLYCAEHDLLTNMIFTMSLIIAFALLCMFFILPRAKGLFMAAIWMTRRTKENENDSKPID